MKRSSRNGVRFERLEGRALLTGVSGDFNGDGFDDLAIGAPGDDVGGVDNTGSVQIIYGSPSGLSANNQRLFHLNTAGIDGNTVAGANFGKALAVGDFDGDGFDDLAIGASGEVISGVDAGAVHILFGSTTGLTAVDDQRLHQNTSGIDGVAAEGNLFGFALAAGDFDNDGRDDLAIGVPGQDIGGDNDAGAVTVLYGRSSGLTASGDQFYSQSTSGVDGVAHADEQFGFAVAAGNFNGDARDDLAIGIVNDDVAVSGDSTKLDAGAVTVLYGRNSAGLSSINDLYLNSGLEGVQGGASKEGHFGHALAAGDFNDDGFDELAVGAPGEHQTGGNIDSGAVHVFRGTGGGISIVDDQKWDKGVADIADSPAADGDQFGAALTIGLIDSNRTDDLIIGVPGNTVSANAGAGSIRVLYGSLTSQNATDGGLTSSNTQNLSQTITGLGPVEAGDHFGSALTMGDFNGDRRFDVAIGVPQDETDTNVQSGSVNVLYSSGANLGTTNGQRWLAGVGGLSGSSHEGDEFGGAVG